MQATFTYDGRYTRHLEIPISAEKICMAFGWENQSIGSNSRHIQPSNGIFTTLQNGETYEIILPQQRCTFVYNGESVNEDISKASQKFLGDRFKIKPDTIILNDGRRDIISTDGLFINLTGSTYQVISQPRPQPANVRQVKIQIRVPEEYLNNLHGSLMNGFQDYSHIKKYKDLDNLLQNSEETFLRAKKFQHFSLGKPIEEGFETFHSAVIKINNAEHEAFSTIEQGLAEIKRELSDLPLALLDTVAIPNSFDENRERIRGKMQEDVTKKIQEANTFIGIKLKEIIGAVEKPKELAKKLSELISNKVTTDEQIEKGHNVFLAEYESTLSQLDENIKRTDKALRAAIDELSAANSRVLEANKLREGWFSKSQQRYKTTKNIKLIVLIDYLLEHFKVSLPELNTVATYKTVYLQDFNEILDGLSNDVPLVKKLEDYTKQLAVLSSPMSSEDHETLQKFRKDLMKLETELRLSLDDMEKDGTLKENASRAADCSEKVAKEKINLFEKLQVRYMDSENVTAIRASIRENTLISEYTIRILKFFQIQKKNNAKVIAERTKKMLDENNDKLITVTQAACVSNDVNFHLDSIKQLFGNIIAALKLTQGHANSNLKDKFERYLQTMNFEITCTSQEDAQNQMELWNADTIQAIGWIAQICTTCTVFEKLYTEVIKPGLQKNSYALYTGKKLENIEVNSATEIIKQLSIEAPKEAVKFIRQIHKPLNVYVGFIKNEPETKAEEPESQEEKSDDEEPTS